MPLSFYLEPSMNFIKGVLTTLAIYAIIFVLGFAWFAFMGPSL